ncbi:MAG: hypothetical protein WC637_22855, partial [Victivallales bacterium]
MSLNDFPGREKLRLRNPMCCKVPSVTYIFNMVVRRKIFIALILSLAVGISYLGCYSFLKLELSRKISEIRKAGYPGTPEELEKWYPEPPSGQNAADFYLKANGNYVRNPGSVDEQFL